MKNIILSSLLLFPSVAFAQSFGISAFYVLGTAGNIGSSMINLIPFIFVIYLLVHIIKLSKKRALKLSSFSSIEKIMIILLPLISFATYQNNNCVSWFYNFDWDTKRILITIGTILIVFLILFGIINIFKRILSKRHKNKNFYFVSILFFLLILSYGFSYYIDQSTMYVGRPLSPCEEREIRNNIPPITINYEYDKEIYLKQGYKFKARINKTDSESDFINRLRNENSSVKIHDLVGEKGKIDVWIK